LAALPAVAISCRPSAFAHWQAIRPTPPAAAWNSTWSPGCRPSTGSVFFSRYCAVRPLSIMPAAVSKAMPSGSLTTVFAGITRTSLYEPGGLLA
jgi:hypothetical protein